MRQKDRQRREEEIDKLHDRLVRAGERDPGAQYAIAQTMGASIDFTYTLWQSFDNFPNELTNNITSWGDEVSTKVRGWVNGAIDSVSKFFSGLFSVD